MPASPSTARAINDRLALRLLQHQGPLTAGQLKQLTGLSRPTVADLVERLTAAGLIAVVGESGEQRRGPNAKLYGIVADRAHLAALDIRTEGVAVLVSDLLGQVLAEASVPIGDDTGTGSAVEQAVTLVERVAKEAGADRLHTLGIGAPGLIDPASGDLRDSSGLPEWHRQLVAALQERFPQARVSVENETNLAALAEQRDGAARDRDTFVLLWLGMGIGAAVVLDGTLRRGASGGAGEIGFLPVPGTTGLPSATDCDGGFHSLAGAGAIADLAAQHGLTAPPTAHEPRAAALVRAAVEAVEGRAAMVDGAAVEGRAVLLERVAAAADTTVAVERVGEGRAAAMGKAVEGPVAGVDRAHRGAFAKGDPRAGDGRVASHQGPDSDADRSLAASADGGRAVPCTGPAVGGFLGVRAEDGRAGSRPGPAPDAGRSPDALAEGGGAGPPTHPEFDSASHQGPDADADRSPAAPAEGDRAAPPPSPAPDRFLDALADRVALGAAAVIAVLDPGCVVLAGEIGRAGGDTLALRVQDRLARLSPLPTEVRPSALGGGAVLRGALLTAREQAQDELFAPRRTS
nr:ROK family transcriptional regulator [Streptomyces sp. V4I2]